MIEKVQEITGMDRKSKAGITGFTSLHPNTLMNHNSSAGLNMEHNPFAIQLNHEVPIDRVGTN
jgi:hypothetical protein